MAGTFFSPNIISFSSQGCVVEISISRHEMIFWWVGGQRKHRSHIFLTGPQHTDERQEILIGWHRDTEERQVDADVHSHTHRSTEHQSSCSSKSFCWHDIIEFYFLLKNPKKYEICNLVIWKLWIFLMPMVMLMSDVGYLEMETILMAVVMVTMLGTRSIWTWWPSRLPLPQMSTLTAFDLFLCSSWSSDAYQCIFVLREGVKKTPFFWGDLSQMWVGGVADSQTRSKLLQITPKIAFFDANFTFRFPKSHKTLGWVNRFGKGLQKKTVFLHLP